MPILKFKSTYTDQEYELEAYERVENNNKLFIVSHNALKNLLHSELLASLEIKYEVKMLIASKEHSVAICTMQDKNGRRTTDIGESTTLNLETEIARGIPATTAWNRALDRCIISHLGFNGRVYSTEEINEDTTPVQPAEKQSAQKTDVIPEAHTARKTTQATAPQKTSAAATHNSDEIAKLGDTMIKVARYATNPQKLSALWRNDNAMVHWICDKYTPSSEFTANIKEACIRYRDLMSKEK